MRRLVLLLLIALWTLPAATAVEPTTLSLASDRWPPFTDDVGRPRFALELVQEALRRIGVKPQFTIVEAAKLEPTVLSGSVDGSAALWQSTTREKVLRYSRPYLENRLILVGRAGTDVSAPVLAALAGQRVGVVGGYAYGGEVARDPSAGPTFVEGPDDQTNLNRLMAGEVDVILIDELVLRFLLQTSARAAADRLEIATSPILRAELRFAIRKDHPQADAILFAFNREVQAMMADGSYNRILRQNWIVADVNDDGRPEYVLSGDAAGVQPPGSAYAILQGRAPAGSDAARSYHIGNTTYDSWDAIPAAFKRPVDDIAQPTTEPGIVIRVGP